MRRIEVSNLDGSSKELYLVSGTECNAIEILLQKLSDKDDDYLIDAEDIFPDLKDPKKRPIIAFRGIRSKNQITQEQLAQKLGITQAEVSKIESGKRAIGKKLAKKIEKTFKMDYRRFL